MVDDLIQRCANLTIMEEEEIISLSGDADERCNRDISLSIVGKVLTDRPYNFDAFKRTMNQIWAISKGAIFRPIENNLFAVQFAHARDRAKILDGSP